LPLQVSVVILSAAKNPRILHFAFAVVVALAFAVGVVVARCLFRLSKT
jgi:hypothetical protein